MHDEALDVLPALLAEHGIASPVLVGHSDGGSIALIHASRHPVTGIVTLAAHAFVEPITTAAIARARDAFENGDLAARMGRHHDDPGAAFHGWCDVWLDPEFAGWDITADIAAITAPALVIQGEDDPYGTLQQVERIAGSVKGSVTRLVLPGGHSPHLEHPQATVEAITAFADGLP